MAKVDEANFKLVKETQNIKNAQSMNTRNISLNKKSLEEIFSKITEIEKKINTESITEPKNNLISSNIQPSEDIPTVENEKNNTAKNKRNNILTGNLDFLNNLRERSLESNKELEKKIKEVNKKVNELDKICKTFSTLDNYYQAKNEISEIRKSLNKYATNSDVRAVYNKSEENEKEIKFIKMKYEDLEINLDAKDDFKGLKKKVELFHNRIENLETAAKNFKKNIENAINEINDLNEKIKIFLEIKTFDNFKNQLTKEFSNININFIHTRKLLDEIVDTMKEKVSHQDIKLLEKNFEAKLESVQLSSYKKFCDKIDTIKTFKYIEQQIKTIFEILQKRSGENDGWLIAKKPLNLNLCASCESYIGDLKDNNPYVPWNKYPLRDTNDKLYRLGNGYSKMLQMLNIEENEKRNLSGSGIGVSLREDLGNMIKKNEKTESTDFSGDLTFNKTMRNFLRSPKSNFPVIKKKLLAKNKSELNSLVETKNDEKNRRNKISDLNNIKSTENSGTNTDNKNVDNGEEQVIVSTSPKITKITKKK